MKTIVLTALVASFANLALGAEQLIGQFKTLQHDVSGKVYAKDDKTIVIYNFKYDGKGPDAFFWIGKSGTPKNTNEDSTYILSEEENYSYRDQDAPTLGAYESETITLTIPEGWQMSDIKWISVWCRQFSVNFGELVVADGFKASSGDINSPVAEPEAEPEQEPEPIPDVDNHLDHEGHAEPESEPSQAEPESEPASATTFVPAFTLVALVAMLI
jgi:hypothetical protein